MNVSTILVIGDTGSGKSSLLNAVLNIELIETSDSPTPCTKGPASFSSMFGDNKLIGLDSEGFNDCQNKIEVQIPRLGDFLRSCMTGVNVIAVVIQYQLCRFSQGVMNTIKFVYDTFHTEEMLSHFCIVFTHCPSNCDKAVKVNTYNEQAKKFLRQISGVTDVPDIPMFFVQTRKKHKPEMIKELENIRNLMLSKSALLTKEVYDALYGFKEEIEKEIKVSQGYSIRGNYKYEIFIDRERIIKIPNNGSDRKYSEWKETNRYEELVEEEKKEREYDVFDGYEIDGKYRYRVYYDRYRTIKYNHRLNRNTYVSGWTWINRTRKFDKKKEKYYEYDEEKQFDDVTENYVWYRISRIKRKVTINFDGSKSYGDWKEYDFTYTHEEKEVKVRHVYETETVYTESYSVCNIA